MDVILCGGEKVIYWMVWVNAPCWYSDIHHPQNISKNCSIVMNLDGIQRKANSVCRSLVCVRYRGVMIRLD